MAEACYVPQYLPASFKGITFEALESTSEHGRRGAEGEFPFGEATAYADLGRRIRQYSISARFLQNDHILRSRLLIAACESIGPGILIHPTAGIVTVACRSAKVKDNPVEELGVTYVDLDFVEANDWVIGLNFGGALQAVTIAIITAAITNHMNDNYHPSEVPFYDRNEVLDVSRTAVSSMRQAFQIATSEERSIKVYRALAAFDSLVNDPIQMDNVQVMTETMFDGMALVDKYARGQNKIDLFLSIINSMSLNSNSLGVSQITIEAILSSMRILGAGYLASSAMETIPKDMDAAFKQYDQVAAVLDQEQQIAKENCDHKLYLAIVEFSTQVKTLLLDRAYNLPALVEFTFAYTTSSLNAAYQIFGDAKQFREIEQRNASGLPWQVGPRIIAARDQ